MFMIFKIKNNDKQTSYIFPLLLYGIPVGYCALPCCAP